MKLKLAIGLSLMLLTSCGYKSRDNETVGQIKKVHRNTPLICPDYYNVDVSLGLMINGTGSMSHEDMSFVVTQVQANELQKLAEQGKLVKLTYDLKRLTFCTEQSFIIKFNEVDVTSR